MFSERIKTNLVTWVSDVSGVAWQHLQYEPYGGGWVDERTDEARSKGFSSRYRFTGKERDAESGLDYFGARYYWSGGGLWLSVDPLADNYPFLSPYVYGAGNPVVLVDADGRRLHFPGTAEKKAFLALIMSFRGITDENKFKAFGITRESNGVYYGAQLTKEAFKRNYERITKTKLTDDELEDAYLIHKAVSSENILEIMVLFSPTSTSSTISVGNERWGTEFVDELEGHKSSTNYHPMLTDLINAIKNKVDEDKFNAIFDHSGTKGTQMWRFIPYKPENRENNDPFHQGTLVINGNRATSVGSAARCILEGLGQIKIKCPTCILEQ